MEQSVNERSNKLIVFNKNQKRNRIIKTIIAYLLPFLILIGFEVFFNLYNYRTCFKEGFQFHYKLKVLPLGLIIIYTLFFFILSVSKKTKTPNIALSIILLLISIASQMKIAFTSEPAFWSDLLFFKNTGGLYDMISETFWENFKQYIIVAIFEIIYFVLIIIMGIKTNIDVKKGKIRITEFVVSIIIMILLFVPFNFTTKFLLNNVFDYNKRKDYAAIVSSVEYFLNYGNSTGIYEKMLENRNIEPDDYNDEILEEELKVASNIKTEKTFGKPNIIVIFSEAFFDVDQLDEVKFDKKVTPNFNKLKSEGLFFNMISPSYGGLSANVSFEILTGGNTEYFMDGYVPVMQLYTGKYEKMPSVLTELKKNDYYTKIVFGRDFYKSKNAFLKMGFDEYQDIDSTGKAEDIKGYDYVSDEYLINNIMKELENKDDSKKLFYMIETIQNHMPYTKDKYHNYDIKLEKSKLPENINEAITAYAQGIYDADKQLGRLYEYIQKSKEPTVILFLGDHLPYLNAGKDDVLNILDYFNTDDKTLNIYRKYNTQSLMLANFEMKKEKNLKYIGPDYLCTYILNHMDIDVSDYFKWLYSKRNIMSSSNRFVTQDSKGNIYNTNGLQGELKDIYNLRKNMQYKLFIKR